MTVSSLSSSSLMTLLGMNTTSGSTYNANGSSSVDPTTQAILDAVAKASGSTTGTTTSGNGVSISTDAKLAAADATDNAKDFGALTTEVRTELDSGKADMTTMSGRALSAIILNQSKNFSSSEIAAAKHELNGRSREDFTLLAGGGNVMGGLSAYNTQLVSQYDSMSDEERQARGWTPAMRSSAQAFVTASQSTTTTSLFDQINQADSSNSTGPFGY